MSQINEPFDYDKLRKAFQHNYEMAEMCRENGEYTESGIRYLSEAGKIQLTIYKHTKEDANYDIAQKIKNTITEWKKKHIPQEETPQADTPVEVSAPAATSSASGTASAKASSKKDEKTADEQSQELAGFDINNYILKDSDIGDVSLEDLEGTNKELVQALIANFGYDYTARFPNIKNVHSLKSSGGNHFLFFGPPGCGKTHLLRALAKSMKERYPENSAFLLLNSGDITSKFKGTAEHRIQAIFDEANKYEFSIVCLDEMEKLGGDRDSDYSGDYTTTLLDNINGVRGKTKAMVIGATNFPWKVDNALLSRLSNSAFIDLPKAEEFVNVIRNDNRLSDAFGFDEAEKERLIQLIADRLIEKKCSFRPLLQFCDHLVTIRVMKGNELYPNGDVNIECLPIFTEEMLIPLLDGVVSDFNKEVYENLKKYYQERTFKKI